MAFGFGGLLGGGTVPDVQMPDGLPVSGGKGSPLVDAFLALQAKRIQDAVTAPRDSITGDLPIFGPDGHPTAEAMDRANGMAGLAMTGSMPFSAPAGSLRMFGGRNAATADQHALKEAEWLHNAGGDREHIWDATGWFKAPDGNWKFEIPDELSTIGTPKNAPAGYGQLHHDDLAQAYPSMWQNTGQSIREAPVASGRYDALGEVIHAQGPTDAAQRSVALHEMQHAIQREEGFARGDNPANFGAADWEAAGRPMLSEASDAAAAQSAWARDQYHRSAGEVEARNVQARADMTPEQRFSTPPWLTQDVPDAQQIVRLYSGGPSGAAAGLPALTSSSDPKGPPVSAGLDTAAPSMLDGLSPELIARLLQAQQPQQAAPSPVDSLLFDRAGMGAPDNGFSGSSGTVVSPRPPQVAQPAPAPGPQATGAIPQAAPVPDQAAPEAPPAATPAPAGPAPTPPTRASEISSLGAGMQPVSSFDPLTGQPVSGMPKPVAAPAAAAPSSGLDLGGMFGRLSDPRIYNTLLGIGAGILQGKNFGEGLGQGIENAQRMNAQQGATDLQQLKLQREQAALTGNAQILKRAYPNLSDAELAAMATNSGNVTTALQILRDPTHGMPKTPEQIQNEARAQAAGSMEGGAKPLDRVQSEAQAQAAGTMAGNAKPLDRIEAEAKAQAAGTAAGRPDDDEGAKLAAQIEVRRQKAAGLGLVEGSPAWQSFVGTGKIGRDQEMSATDKKAINAAEDELPLLSQTIATLKRAKELNNQTFTGITAGVRGKIGTSVPGASMFLDPKASEATREFGQLMSMEAIKSMSSTLKGATTDTEMSRFMDILGDPATPPDIRARTLDRMHTLALRQEQIAKARVNDLRGGTYYKKGGGAPDQTEDEGGAPAPVTGAKRMRFDPTTGGFN